MTPGVEDVVFGFMRFPSGMSAHLHLSWLDPHKERRFTVVGSKKMATFDDMDPERKVTIFDKRVEAYKARSGDIWSPSIPLGEPLRIECQHFLDCIAEGRAPVSDGASGLRVVRVLERLQDELELTRREVTHG
jgi:predicted dehydrogenase